MVALDLLLIASAIAVVISIVRDQSARHAYDVIADLDHTDGDIKQKLNSRKKIHLGDALSQMGLFETEERQKFISLKKSLPFICSGIFVFIRLISFAPSISGAIVCAVMGLCVGYIASERLTERKKKKFENETVFYLPIVMERIVMAVESGLDVLPAIGAILELDDPSKRDPVTKLLAIVHQLTESGNSFDESLRSVASQVESGPLRHAFIHLGVAQSDGGEIMGPLRELSDSTQLFYQETAEEEVAKLPIKATMPLVMTFGGLIMVFMASPLVQIIKSLSEASLGVHK